MFSILSWILSKNMCKLRRKLHNANIYPLEVQILQIIFVRCHIMYNLGNYSTYLSPHYQTSVNCVTNWKMPKKLPELTWSWQNKPWSTDFRVTIWQHITTFSLAPRLIQSLSCNVHNKKKALKFRFFLEGFPNKYQ